MTPDENSSCATHLREEERAVVFLYVVIIMSSHNMILLDTVELQTL